MDKLIEFLTHLSWEQLKEYEEQMRFLYGSSDSDAEDVRLAGIYLSLIQDGKRECALSSLRSFGRMDK